MYPVLFIKSDLYVCRVLKMSSNAALRSRISSIRGQCNLLWDFTVCGTFSMYHAVLVWWRFIYNVHSVNNVPCSDNPTPSIGVYASTRHARSWCSALGRAGGEGMPLAFISYHSSLRWPRMSFLNPSLFFYNLIHCISSNSIPICCLSCFMCAKLNWGSDLA